MLQDLNVVEIDIAMLFFTGHSTKADVSEVETQLSIDI